MKFRSPHTPLRAIPHKADNAGNDRMQHLGPLAAGQSKRADACASLFEVCGAMQNKLLDPLGVTCFSKPTAARSQPGAATFWRRLSKH